MELNGFALFVEKSIQQDHTIILRLKQMDIELTMTQELNSIVVLMI
jgi:hypothetical protein